MTGRISLDADAMDGACRQLRTISDSLEVIEKKLGPELTRGLPPYRKADFAGDIARVRKGVHQQSLSSGRQAVELRNRASLTRLAAGEGSPRDVAILLSLCAGSRAVDPKKRPGLYRAIVALQNAAFSGPVLGGGAPRKPNVVDRALTRWAQWMGRGALEKKPFGSGSLTRLRATVVGKPMGRIVGPMQSHMPGWLKNPSNDAAPEAAAPAAGTATPDAAPLVAAAVVATAIAAARGDRLPGKGPRLMTPIARRRPDPAAA